MKKHLFILLLISLYFPMPVSYGEGSSHGGEGGGYFTYHSPQEIFSYLLNVSERWDLAYVVNSTDVGVEGREIRAIIIGKNGTSTLLVVGAHHGDEPVSAEIPFYFVQYLFEEWKRGDSAVKHLLNTTRVVVVPVLNPFGLEAGVRWDEYGQDINRDYPYDPSPPEPYNDGKPLSTAGTRFMDYLFRVYQPSLALSFHSGRRMLLYPWGSTVHTGPTPDDAIFRMVGEALSSVAEGEGGTMPIYEANNASGVSYLHGAWLDWAYASSWDLKNVVSDPLPSSTLSFTIEISRDKSPPGDQLGRWEEVEGGGGGYVSEGVRMCLKALDLTTPSAEVLARGRGYVKIRFHGDPAPGELRVTEIEPEVKPLEMNCSREGTLFGWVYNITFSEEAEVVRIMLSFGDYLGRNTSAKSLYYTERSSTTMLTGPIHLYEHPPSKVGLKVLGRPQAGGNLTIQVLGVGNFTFLGAHLNISHGEYNLSSGACVSGNTVTLPLPPRSGEGSLVIYLGIGGEAVELSTTIMVLPSLHLGGVPERVEAGEELLITPYAYGEIPGGVVRVEVAGPGGFRETFNATLYESFRLRTPFAVGNMTIRAVGGGVNVSYSIQLLFTIRIWCSDVVVRDGELRIGPVFLSAPSPETLDPGEVNVSALMLSVEGVEVLRINLTFNETFTPPKNETALEGVQGGFFGKGVLNQPGNYTVYLIAQYPGGEKRVYCGSFSIDKGGAERVGEGLQNPIPLLAIGLLVALFSFVALIIYHFFTLRRMVR